MVWYFIFLQQFIGHSSYIFSEIAVIVPSRHGILKIDMEIAQNKYVVELKMAGMGRVGKVQSGSIGHWPNSPTVYI